MIVSYKIRIYPNKTQINKCNKMFGGCRFVYNLYLAHNIDKYNNGEKITSWKKYRKNIKEMRESDYPWLKELYKHSLDNSIKVCNKSFEKFFKKNGGFPHFKSKKNPVQSFYLDSNDTLRFYKKHVNLPFLGKVRITEPDYVPLQYNIIGITIKKEDEKYYAIFRIRQPKESLDKSPYLQNQDGYGYGIDVGVKTFATVVDSYLEVYQYPSFLRDERINKLENRIKRLQRIISRKMETTYGIKLNEFLDKYHKEPNKIEKKKMKGESFSNTCRYIQNKINRCYRKITNIKKDMINKIISGMVKNKPEYITIETLSISDMLEGHNSRLLKKYIQSSKFSYFFEHLKYKSYIYNIDLRMADKYYPSSKKCCMCGNINHNLKIYNRIYECNNKECMNIMDRDVNAAINLLLCKKYNLFV